MGYNTHSYKTQVDKCIELSRRGIPFAVIDLETTGKSANNNYIFEFAGIKLLFDENLNAKVVDHLSGFMKPAEPLSPVITKITGFTNEDVKDKPLESVVFPKIAAFMNNTILCSHNTTFEKGFMEAMYQRNNMIFSPVDIIDTLKMSRDLHSEEKSHKLGEIAARYGLDKDVHFHDAKDDTLICAKVLARFINEYSEIVVEDETSKIIPRIISIRFWEATTTNKNGERVKMRHDQNRIYVSTNEGTFWWSTYYRTWGNKAKDDNMFKRVNMSYLEKKVLELTHCKDLDELSRFKGDIKC